jgi:hypothetical protein
MGVFDKMLFAAIAYNQYTASVKRIRNRKNHLKFKEVFSDQDEIASAASRVVH